MSENGSEFAWQEGFGAFSVSPSQAETVKRYIRNLAQHHKKRNFEEELLLLLKKSGVDYDPGYVPRLRRTHPPVRGPGADALG
jgi:putative transposase